MKNYASRENCDSSRASFRKLIFLTCYCDDCDVSTCARDGVDVQIFPTTNHAEVLDRDVATKLPTPLSTTVTTVMNLTMNFLLFLLHLHRCKRDAEGVTLEVVRIRWGPRCACSCRLTFYRVWRTSDNWGFDGPHKFTYSFIRHCFVRKV